MQFKIPKDYDFSHKGKDWKSYNKDFLLRTDAVWEKQQLRDYFRLYMKCFWFNVGIQNYELVEPEDLMTIHYEGWALEDFVVHTGFTPTGRTNSFQVALPPKQQVAVSTSTNQVHEDYFDLCTYRFEHWHKCDMVYYDERDKYDYREKDYKNYPCFREFYEATFACQDDLFEFLMELNYAKKASGTFEADVANWEITSNPSVYDTPKGGERKTYTY